MDEDLDEKIEEKTEELFNNILSSISEGKKTDVFDHLDEESFRSLLARINISGDADLKKAYFLGVWKTLYDIQKRLTASTTNDIVSLNNLNSYKHLYPFIEYLYDRNVVNHAEAADFLGIKTNALSNFLSRIKKYNYYSEQKFGKQKFYIITNHGRKLYHAFCKKKNTKLDSAGFKQRLTVNCKV